MQTFLAYPSFAESAKVLDMRRLGKQRVEVLQILKALYGEGRGWRNHPITKAWKGHELVLITYGIRICQEWIKRGYKDTCMLKIRNYSESTIIRESLNNPPSWAINLQLYSSYRALLLHKDPVHYGQFGWTETPIEKLDYSLFETS
jgi:hypothetical protein